MLKQLLFAALALPWLCAGPAAAQGAPAAQGTAPAATAATASSTETAPPEGADTIVVQGHRDRAMNAFLSGDFVTAEREFGENLSCIQRIETLQSFAFEQAQTDELRSDFANAAGLPGGNGVVTPTAPPVSYNIHQRRARVPERTCTGPDWQLYMMGLSQIGQGKLVEAKATLYRVVRSSNNPYLFDAHYKVGLLELLDGNIDEANNRLEHLRRMQSLCNHRGDSCEIKAELDYAVAYLTYSIDAARRGELNRGVIRTSSH